MNQKKPWSVKYNQFRPEWHPQSRPYIADADGDLVLDMPQFVEAPGIYDERADKMAQEIVVAVNAYQPPKPSTLPCHPRGTVVRGFITRFRKEAEWEEVLVETDNTDDADAIPHYVRGCDGRFYEYYGHSMPANGKVYVVAHSKD